VPVNGSCAQRTKATLHQCELPGRLAGMGSTVEGRSKATDARRPRVHQWQGHCAEVTHFVPARDCRPGWRRCSRRAAPVPWRHW
jgi:hypothetical protein